MLRIARVAVAAPINKTLSYLLPERFGEEIAVGIPLRVPLGRRMVTGFLLEQTTGRGDGLKEVIEALDSEPLFPPQMIPLFHRCAEYYRHPIGEVIRAALPAGISVAAGIPTEKFFTPTDKQGDPAGARQRAILDWLRRVGAASLTGIAGEFPAPHGVLKRLTESGFLAVAARERPRDPFFSITPPADRPVDPTPEQLQASHALHAAVDQGGFSPFLLHGVTGSGKTEIYLQAIARVLQQGRQAMVLVPEIALTPQLVGRFRARFATSGVAISVLHSGLSDGERLDAWRIIARGGADIVIGARSAVFAPLARLGVIIVDEEHEGGYKQNEGFRYHARDVALLRGQMAAVTVVLGSATPAITTFHRARTGQIGYLPLTHRVAGRPLPDVEMIDLRQNRPAGILSAELTEALRRNLEAGGQALLLLNRRGFSPFLLCADCGATFRCPNCEITLTFYVRERRLLRCNYCDYVASLPDLCPRCAGGNLQPEGAGTERLEDELSLLFPSARIARMDRDSTSRKGAHQSLVDRMESQTLDILVGTQMVAKGHDFPGVSLVGVINADATLNFPDFRSAERTFALLTQVAGRAGRGDRTGRVLIQTFAADHYALACAAEHDYERFYREEIIFREELNYPPFGFLANLVLSGNAADKVTRAAAALGAGLQEVQRGVEVLGPAPCPLARLRGKTRIQILLKAPARPPLRLLLAELETLSKKIPAGVRLAVDVDPMDML